MESAISISETLGRIRDGRAEVVATAVADYDMAKEMVSVKLEAFTRRPAASGDGGRRVENWLPCGECVTESLSRKDAAVFAKDVFQSWIKKVRASISHELRRQSAS